MLRHTDVWEFIEALRAVILWNINSKVRVSSWWLADYLLYLFCQVHRERLLSNVTTTWLMDRPLFSWVLGNWSLLVNKVLRRCRRRSSIRSKLTSTLLQNLLSKLLNYSALLLLQTFFSFWVSSFYRQILLLWRLRLATWSFFKEGESLVLVSFLWLLWLAALGSENSFLILLRGVHCLLHEVIYEDAKGFKLLSLAS